MFADLDIVFFDGYLLGNTCVEWVKLGVHHRAIWGQSVYASPRQRKIELNAERIFLLANSAITPGKGMWSTMLHEMCQ